MPDRKKFLFRLNKCLITIPDPGQKHQSRPKNPRTLLFRLHSLKQHIWINTVSIYISA